MQLTSHGIKIHTFSDLEFKSFQKHCTDNAIEFYTHATRDDKLTKIVLYGLPDSNEDFIKKNLNHEKLYPVEVKKLKINNTKYDYQCHYLLYFKKSGGWKLAGYQEKF